jgi:hypothetical protein
VSEQTPSRQREAFLLAAVVGVIGLVGAAHHELWRDEAEIWLIARDSATPGELLTNMSTEGHPVLWYAINWLLARITPDPRIMQLFHVGIAAALAWTVARHAPFPRVVRVLFCFGYYPIYEFNVISRAYGLQVLLALAICVLWPRRGQVRWWIALLLALLAQTVVYGAIVAGALILAMMMLSRNPDDPLGRLPIRARIGPFALAAAGIAAGAGHAFWQASRMGSDHLGVYQPGYSFKWFAEATSTLLRGGLPLPEPGNTHLWNSNFVDALGTAATPLGLLAGAALLVLGLWSLRSSPALAASFAVGTGAMFSITLFLWYGQQRHHSQPFLFWWVCAWIAVASGMRWTRFHSRVLVALLTVHCVAGAWLLATDIGRPFSHAHNVARMLETDEWLGRPVVGHIDYAAQPINAWLDRPIYYPETRVYGTFLDWSERRKEVSAEAAMGEAIHMARDENREVALVLNYGPGILDLGQEIEQDGLVIRHTHRFEGAIVPTENYYIYLIAAPNP